MIDHNRIRHFLNQGLGPSDIASIVGCTPQYISSLKADPDFRASLEEAKVDESEDIKKSTEELEEVFLANKYLALEHKCIEKLTSSLPMAELKETIMTLRTVGERHNALRDRSLKTRFPLNNTAGNNVQVAIITIRQNALPEYTLNNQNEVVAIDNKPLAPMSSNAVKSLFDQTRSMKLVEV